MALAIGAGVAADRDVASGPVALALTDLAQAIGLTLTGMAVVVICRAYRRAVPADAPAPQTPA